MGMLCAIGWHSWNFCKCRWCGLKKDVSHNWQGCKCASCGKERDEEHDWQGCKCGICGRQRDEDHDWDGCKCKSCGKVRNQGHALQRCICSICGEIRIPPDLLDISKHDLLEMRTEVLQRFPLTECGSEGWGEHDRLKQIAVFRDDGRGKPDNINAGRQGLMVIGLKALMVAAEQSDGCRDAWSSAGALGGRSVRPPCSIEGFSLDLPYSLRDNPDIPVCDLIAFTQFADKLDNADIFGISIPHERYKYRVYFYLRS
jgi:hypothetical protein